jgi:hypothetical protein
MDWWEKCLGTILVCEDRNCGGFNPFRILLTSGGGFLFHNIVLSATCMIIRIIHRNGAYDSSPRYSECNALCWLLGASVLKRGCINSRSIGNFEPILYRPAAR